ncbi:hypothetical protein LTS18_014581, partial [Coniosporium uncinatum]
VFRNNAFELGSAGKIQLAVFRGISRINHSCLPNAEGNFNAAIGRFTIHALRDIVPDEEIMISYLDSRSAIRKTRQEKLLSGYGFSCGCPACNLDLTRAVAGEGNRMKMRDAFASYAENIGADGQTPEKELHLMQKLIGLFEEEGIYGSELGVLYFEVARLYKELGDTGAALRFAQKGLAIDANCIGVDNALYNDRLDKLKELESAVTK